MSEIIIDLVKVDLRTSDIQRIKFDGRTGIFDHPEVIRYTDKKDGKIKHIEGRFKHKTRWFEFTINYATESGYEFGRVSVEKQGKSVGEIDLREEVYEIVYELFEDHFIPNE